MRQLRLLIGNDMLLELVGLRDGAIVQDAATVSVTIRDRRGTEVPGATWPMAMTSMGGGDYQAILPASLVVKPRESYDVEISVDAGGSIGQWRRSVIAQYRAG